MGIFQKKQNSDAVSKPVQDEPEKQDVTADVDRFFDDVFREELRNHGRWYFEKVISENAALFKDDLTKTMEVVRDELKAQMVQQLDQQVANHGKVLEEAQANALQSLKDNAQSLGEQHQQLVESLRKNIADQEAMLIKAMRDAQEQALQSLTRSAEALEEQRQQLSSSMQENIKNQERLMIEAFEHNMAHIVEGYLTEAIRDKYDISMQLPAIITQLNASKQEIVDDMKL